jgi:uncharacterized protein
MDASPWAYLLLAAVGFVASVLNVVAAGGSFLTLPLLIFLGLPTVEANATNRIGVIAQNAISVWGFHRHGVLDWRWAAAASLPAGFGALVGAWLALDVKDTEFRRILASLMVAITLWTLVDPIKRVGRVAERSPWSFAVAAGMFVTGIYGGFVQAGVGFFAVAVTTLSGIDLVRGAAIKVFTIGVVTVIAAGVFAWHGHIDWPAGLSLAAGSLAGGSAGVHMAVLKGHRWLQHVVTCTVVLFAVLLWVS